MVPRAAADGFGREYAESAARSGRRSTLGVGGRKGDRGAGNGAAMRIAPLPSASIPKTDDGRRTIRDVCRITHHNDEAHIGAVASYWRFAPRRSKTAFPARPNRDRLPETSVRDRLTNMRDSTVDCRSLTRPPVRVIRFVIESAPSRSRSSPGTLARFAGMLEQVFSRRRHRHQRESRRPDRRGRIGSRRCRRLGGPLPQAQMVLDIAQRFADVVRPVARP